jgi:hypothetical protein
MFGKPSCFACISTWENDKILIFFQKMRRQKLCKSCMIKFLFENKKFFQRFFDCAQFGENQCTVKKQGFMNLQRVINPFSILEIANKRKKDLLSLSYTKKRVCDTLQIDKPFFGLWRSQKRFFRLLFSGNFLQCTLM